MIAEPSFPNDYVNRQQIVNLDGRVYAEISWIGSDYACGVWPAWHIRKRGHYKRFIGCWRWGFRIWFPDKTLHPKGQFVPFRAVRKYTLLDRLGREPFVGRHALGGKSRNAAGAGIDKAI
jgi:hypothetical protein